MAPSIRSIRKAGSTFLVFILLLGGARLVFAHQNSRTSDGNDIEDKRLHNHFQVLDAPLQLDNHRAKNPPVTTFKAYWKDGLRLESSDGLFKLKLGGRIQDDWAWINPDDSVKTFIGDQKGRTEFRRARFYFSGEIYKNTFFKAEYDFADRTVAFKDIYLGINGIPGIGHLKAGHFKEPFSIEELTSNNYVTFMERSLPNVFAPSRNIGVSIYNSEWDERLTWAAGVFHNTDNFGNAKVQRGFSTSFRVTGLPWYKESGAQLAHLGIAYTQRVPNNHLLRFRERPEVHLADRFVDTGTLQADHLHQVGLEGVMIFGPFSVQSEYINTRVGSDTTNDLSFGGFYVYASCFLTGEHRNYKRSTATFDRIRPKRNVLGTDRGPGAWEIAVRYSKLDLNDQLTKGGQLSNVTGGLNWYLNPNTRVMLNYVFANLDTVGDTNTLMMRFQINF